MRVKDIPKNQREIHGLISNASGKAAEALSAAEDARGTILFLLDYIDATNSGMGLGFGAMAEDIKRLKKRLASLELAAKRCRK